MTNEHIMALAAEWGADVCTCQERASRILSFGRACWEAGVEARAELEYERATAQQCHADEAQARERRIRELEGLLPGFYEWDYGERDSDEERELTALIDRRHADEAQAREVGE